MYDDRTPIPDFERCDAFWAREDVDRPLLASWVGSYQMADLYPCGLSELPNGKLDPSDIDFENFRPDYEQLFEVHRQAHADIPWAAFPVMVVPWVEVIVGCSIYHHAGNVWAEPWLDDYQRLVEEGLQLDRAWLEKLVAFIDWLTNLSDGRFPVALSLMRGPADLLAAMRGAEQSIYDLYDHSEHVDGALQLLTDAWIEVARAQLSRVSTFADGYCLSVQNLWAREQGGWFQDDSVAFWSPTFYRRYARSYEDQLSRCMDVTGVHLHAASLFTVDELIKMPELHVIEVNLDDVGLRIPDMIPRFQQILETKRLMVWGAFTVEDLTLMKENLPARGLALQLMGSTPEAVRNLIREARHVWCG